MGGTAADELTSDVYTELRRIAARHLKHDRVSYSLQPTALAHEVYLRLREQHQLFQNKAHVCGVAAGLMRLILLDHAKRRSAGARPRRPISS